MRYPNFNEEKKLWKQGYNIVAGLDEAGRGPLAGPVVAAAVCFEKNLKIKKIKNINDSKKLSEKQREELYEILINDKNIKWGIGIVSEKIIDKINILKATKLAMKEAVLMMNEKDKIKIEFLLVDGNFLIDGIYCAAEQKSIISGDQKVFSIACASIIAKVTRDRIMKSYHKKYPIYGFDKHKGYGTAGHIEKLQKYGPCKIHRKTFYPIGTFCN
jgi:ribonuclease HII